MLNPLKVRIIKNYFSYMKNRDVANLWKRGIFSTIVFLTHVERWNVTGLAEDQWEEEAPACMQVSQICTKFK
jgi:hypothetical protein